MIFMCFEKYLYFKECSGKNGKPIMICKIRTMKLDADKNLESVLSNGRNGHGKYLNDSRITEVGGVLRKYWIDELPQLYNLFKGDIKLVG